MHRPVTGRFRVLVVALVMGVAACADTTPAAPDSAIPTSIAPTTTLAPAVRAWSRATGPVFQGPGHQLISAVGFGGPGIIAVGVDSSGPDADAAVWVSADGETWSRVESPALGGAHAQGLEDLAIGPVGIVAVGWDSSAGDIDASAWFSTDGIVWEKVGGAAFIHEGHEEVHTVLATDTGFVAAGFAVVGREADAAVWTSPNGRTWTRLDDPALGGGGTQRISSLMAGPDGIVAGGTNFLPDEFGLYNLDARVWVSADGSSWEAIDDATFGGPGWQYITSIVAGPNGLVAAGGDILGAPGVDNDAAVWTSTDGTTWARVEDPAFGGERAQHISALGVGDGELVAVGYDTGPGGNRIPAVWRSADGSAWVRIADSVLAEPGHRWMSGVAIAGIAVVAVGTDGTHSHGDPAVWLFTDRRLPAV